MFEVGDRVVCVNVDMLGGYRTDDYDIHLLEIGMCYLIDEARYFPELAVWGLRLGGINSIGTSGVNRVGFNASRFRKLPDVKQSLSELKAIVANTPRVLEVEAA